MLTIQYDTIENHERERDVQQGGKTAILGRM